HGDKVVAAILPGRKGKNPSGRVVRVLERATEIMAVRVLRPAGDGAVLAQATDPRCKGLFVLDFEGRKAPDKGDIVLAAPGDRLEGGGWAGRVVEVLGREFSLETQERIVKANHSVPGPFPPIVLAEAANLGPEPDPEGLQGREDLTNLGLVTIDGEQAKDFDDAVHVRAKGGGWILTVAIADVSHYVQPGSALDREALERGNSFYFPRSVEPMLPEALSNGLCSLVPGRPRLAMAVEMEFDRLGRRTGQRCFAAVIRSEARLTYTQVQGLFSRGEGRDESWGLMLEEAAKLAEILRNARARQGSLDFDLPEPEIIQGLLDGSVGIRARERFFSHRLVEEFMISANECVAEILTRAEKVLPYRVHPLPDPDKLSALFRLLTTAGVLPERPDEITPASLQSVLALVRDTEREFLVNRLMLRTMSQAGYSPTNEGHFGLASECYCHFTSPIRRYADLLVHRVLKSVLARDGRIFRVKPLKRICDGINRCERRAMEAEREMLKRAGILHLRDRIGDVFAGVISGVADFGFWVELDSVLVEGLVRLSTLHDDYYEFRADEHRHLGRGTGRTFGLGQRVTVRLVNTSLDRLEVDLEVEDA
ncbi:MAG: VacB/RNase II family 3'-5' exoribonuclease, partial [Deltaproteobacteria bacterium]|nr:VacB/RNase II family 3'-5' exoribonuclease [Deltaproteobacteria bacterium]